jgi:hypothetical protein
MNLDLSWPLVVALVAGGLGGFFLLRRAIAQMCSVCGHGLSAHRIDGHICESLVGDWVPCGCERFTSAPTTRSRMDRLGEPMADIGDRAQPTPGTEVKPTRASLRDHRQGQIPRAS